MEQPVETAEQVLLPALDRVKLKPDQMEKVRDHLARINFKDELGVMALGVSEQRQLIGTADKLIENARTQDTGPIGATLTELLKTVDDLKVDSLSGYSKKWIFGLPIIGGWLDELQQFQRRYEKIGRKFDQIVDLLEEHKGTLISNISMLSTLAQQNSLFWEEMTVMIAVGEIKKAELEKQLDQMKAVAHPDDKAAAEQISDLAQLVASIDRRLGDLRLAEFIAFQTGVQIRLVRSGHQALIEKIQSSLMTTIPTLKRQAALAIALTDLKQGRQVQAALTDATNKAIGEMGEMLGSEVTATARETERGIVEITTLQKTNRALVQAIQETQQIRNKGASDREVARIKIRELTIELNDRLRSEGSKPI